jgi:NAD(P)-dependent dehydrogenase (short-subunit alcohol dehydrogenase family)
VSERQDGVAVVTGASRGLGSGLAAAFAARGMRLGLCARSLPAAPPGSEALTACVDVRDADAVERFTREVVERFGHIDLWVNNAGVLEPIGPLADTDPEELRRNVDVNVLGVAYGSAAFARHVRGRAGRGLLINISSGAATTVYVGWAAYCASKAAVDMLTAVLASEERSAGLSAAALSPGVIDTDMQALIRAAPDSVLPASDRFRSLYADGRFNAPDQVAEFILDRFATLDDDHDDGDDHPVHPDSVRVRVPDRPQH